MANAPAAIKSVRGNKRRHLRNLGIKSELKTLTKNFQKLVQEKQADKATVSLRTLTKRLDQAASKDVLNRTTVSRKKSRLARSLAKLKTS